VILPLPDDIIESHGKKKKPAPKSTRTPPKIAKKPTSKPARKWEVPEQVSKLVEEIDELKKKKVRKNMTPAEKYEHFLQKIIVRGKMGKVAYF